MKIKKNDTVLIISGKDKGKKGKVLDIKTRNEKILVEGVNLRKKHQKPRKQGEKGQILEMPFPVSISNAKLICPKCSKPTRVGYIVRKSEDGKKNVKNRVCKKCNQDI